MPAFDVLIALFVFCGPGMLFLFAFDLSRNHSTKPIWLHVGLGGMLTLFLYASLSVLGVIDLSELVGQSGGLQLAALFRRDNLLFFLACLVFSTVAGVGLGRWFPDRYVVGLFGRTYTSSTWLKFFQDSPKYETWLHIHTKSGFDWLGYAVELPLSYAGADVVVLKHPELYDAEQGDYVKRSEQFLIVPTADIEYLLVDKYPSPTNLVVQTDQANERTQGQEPQPIAPVHSAGQHPRPQSGDDAANPPTAAEAPAAEARSISQRPSAGSSRLNVEED